MNRRPYLKLLMRFSFLLMSPSLGGLVPPMLLGEVPFRLPWSFCMWRTHSPLWEWSSLRHKYYFPSLFLFPTTPFGSSIIPGGGEGLLIYAGSLLVVSLLEVLNFSDDFLESYSIFWDTHNRASIWASLVSLVDHLPEVRRFVYFFSSMDITCSDVKSLSSYHSLLLVSI